MEKRPRGSKSLDETTCIEGVGQIACDPPDMRILAPGRFFFSKKERLPSPRGCTAGRHQTGCPPSNDNNFPVFHTVIVS